MRFLLASNFACNLNSGAAGTISCIGQALKERGHEVDFIWQGDESRIPQPTLAELFELPRRQYEQIFRGAKVCRATLQTPTNSRLS